MYIEYTDTDYIFVKYVKYVKAFKLYHNSIMIDQFSWRISINMCKG